MLNFTITACMYVCCSLPTTMQTTPTPPMVPPKSKCANRSRALSADQACSGGANIGELLVNQSGRLDPAETSRLLPYICSSQKCFNKYVKAYSHCTIDLSGARENGTAIKLVSVHVHIIGNHLYIYLDVLCWSKYAIIVNAYILFFLFIYLHK